MQSAAPQWCCGWGARRAAAQQLRRQARVCSAWSPPGGCPSAARRRRCWWPPAPRSGSARCRSSCWRSAQRHQSLVSTFPDMQACWQAASSRGAAPRITAPAASGGGQAAGAHLSEGVVGLVGREEGVRQLLVGLRRVPRADLGAGALRALQACRAPRSSWPLLQRCSAIRSELHIQTQAQHCA